MEEAEQFMAENQLLWSRPNRRIDTAAQAREIQERPKRIFPYRRLYYSRHRAGIHIDI